MAQTVAFGNKFTFWAKHYDEGTHVYNGSNGSPHNEERYQYHAVSLVKFLKIILDVSVHLAQNCTVL